MTSTIASQRRASDGENFSAKATTSTRLGLIRAVLSQPLADYYMLIGSSALLIGIGALMVLSSSSVFSQAIGNGPYYFVVRQVVFILAGLPVAFWLSRRGEKFLKNISWLALLGVLGLLVITLAFGFDQGKANQAWINLGVITLQPSEFAKPVLVVWAAAVWSNREKRLAEVKQLLIPVILGFGLVLGLVALQNDLGTAMIIGAIVFAMLFFVGASPKVMASLIGIAVAGVGVMVAQSPNRMMRIFSFLGHEEAASASDQPLNAVYAMASGGWFGRGIGASRQKWGSLYDGAHSDYVIAVLGEELGLVGVLVVIGLFSIFGFAGFRIAAKSTRVFFRICACGITTWTLVQALVNLFVAMRLLPVIGVPLPFISYGGSAMLANLAGLGVLLACAINVPDAKQAMQTKQSRHRHRVSAVVDVRGKDQK